jgi:uncharacterized protein (DUF1810 family)
MTTDPHDLQRFVAAQNEGGTYERALAELRAGRKTSHWMWFVFPQLAGLGNSAMSRTYALGSMREAAAYLEHPLLGTRLRECTRALLLQGDRSAQEILGEVDAVKLRSSMTLFASAAPEEQLFRDVLDRFYNGDPDRETERRLNGESLPDPR